MLLNLLLRNYLHFNLYDQAEKLVSKSVFPELANNNEWARYLYYTGELTAAALRRVPAMTPRSPACHVTHTGRIKAIQLEYSEARRTLTNALRKAPQHTAVGFKQTVRTHTHTHTVRYRCLVLITEASIGSVQVHKLLIVVELLLGEIPDRLQFRQPSLKRSLMPYFLLTQGRCHTHTRLIM